MRSCHCILLSESQGFYVIRYDVLLLLQFFSFCAPCVCACVCMCVCVCSLVLALVRAALHNVTIVRN